MAITRAQQVRQMLEDGGMLVSPSMTGKRPGYRGDDAARAEKARSGSFGSRADPGNAPRGDGPASAGFDQDAKPGKQSPEVYGASGKQYDPEVALAAAKAQGYFDKKNPIEKFFDGYTKGTRKTLYNIFPNKADNELAYLKSLPFSQRALLSPALRAKLEALELDEDQDLLDTANTKFTFDEFEELRKFQPTDDTLNFAEYAAKFKGAPGLLYSGDVGNLIKTKNPDGTFSYRRDFSQDDPILFPLDDGEGGSALPKDPNDGNDDNTQTGSGLSIRFRKDGGRINAMDGGMMSPEGGIMDLETGRQMYFLGKLVKKASRALKKITKSPLGKAAILGGALYFGGGGGLPKLLGGKGLGGFSAKTFFSKANPLLFSDNKLSMGKLAGLSALSPFLFQQEEDEEEEFDRGPGLDIRKIRENPYDFLGPNFANGGRIGYQEGSKEPVAKKTMPLLDMGGKEMDLRDDGGFVPIGRMEKADDVPARLSKNEFVFTADAVRNAGEGDVDKGAEVMYNMMKNLESGGQVSEESQGLEGAREMFQTSKRLEEVL